MKKLWLIPLALFVAAIALIVASVANGEGQVGLFLIFPFITAWGPMAVAGSILLFLAIISFFFVFLRSGEPIEDYAGGSDASLQHERKFGGVVMIGPIPIAFGSDKKTARWMMIAGVIMFAVLVAIYLILVHPFL